jgi:hypothetical protein
LDSAPGSEHRDQGTDCCGGGPRAEAVVTQTPKSWRYAPIGPGKTFEYGGRLRASHYLYRASADSLHKRRRLVDFPPICLLPVGGTRGGRSHRSGRRPPPRRPQMTAGATGGRAAAESAGIEREATPTTGVAGCPDRCTRQRLVRHPGARHRSDPAPSQRQLETRAGLGRYRLRPGDSRPPIVGSSGPQGTLASAPREATGSWTRRRGGVSPWPLPACPEPGIGTAPNGTSSTSGPSWGRETADNSGQPRCPTDNQTHSSTGVSVVIGPQVRIWHARGQLSMRCFRTKTSTAPPSRATSMAPRPATTGPAKPPARRAGPVAATVARAEDGERGPGRTVM